VEKKRQLLTIHCVLIVSHFVAMLRKHWLSKETVWSLSLTEKLLNMCAYRSIPFLIYWFLLRRLSTDLVITFQKMNPVDSGTGPGPSTGRSIYGYALMIFCLISLFFYIAWAFIPEWWLQEHGLTYFSSKYFALAIPVYFSTLVFAFGSFIYPAINYTLTEPINSTNTMIDTHTRLITDLSNFKQGSIPPVSDISIIDVNNMLYLNWIHKSN